MNTLYFIFFSFGIAAIIFWAYRNDDQAEFYGDERNQKFSMQQKKTIDIPDSDE